MVTCVDCAEAGRALTRPAPYVGSDTKARCYRDNIAFTKATTKRRRNLAAVRKYEITPEEDERLLAFQRGVCFICRKATGRTKGLARDHNHRTGEVRARLCGPCNQFIGRLGDDPEAFFRAALHLINPVSRKALARAADGSWLHPIPDREHPVNRRRSA